MSSDEAKRNWTVEGVDAEAAAVAKAASAAAGIPVNEWLSKVILESTAGQKIRDSKIVSDDEADSVPLDPAAAAIARESLENFLRNVISESSKLSAAGEPVEIELPLSRPETGVEISRDTRLMPRGAVVFGANPLDDTALQESVSEQHLDIPDSISSSSPEASVAPNAEQEAAVATDPVLAAPEMDETDAESTAEFMLESILTADPHDDETEDELPEDSLHRTEPAMENDQEVSEAEADVELEEMQTAAPIAESLDGPAEEEFPEIPLTLVLPDETGEQPETEEEPEASVSSESPSDEHPLTAEPVDARAGEDYSSDPQIVVESAIDGAGTGDVETEKTPWQELAGEEIEQPSEPTTADITDNTLDEMALLAERVQTAAENYEYEPVAQPPEDETEAAPQDAELGADAADTEPSDIHIEEDAGATETEIEARDTDQADGDAVDGTTPEIDSSRSIEKDQLASIRAVLAEKAESEPQRSQMVTWTLVVVLASALSVAFVSVNSPDYFENLGKKTEAWFEKAKNRPNPKPPGSAQDGATKPQPALQTAPPAQKSASDTASPPAEDAAPVEEAAPAKSLAETDLPTGQVERNLSWYQEAAKAGNPAAQAGLARIYAEGRGVTQDYEQAAHWYREAASRNFADAQYRLARLFEQGLGVKTDLAEAATWYDLAAQQNHPEAQYRLGLAKLWGRGTPASFETARAWLLLASDGGVAAARFQLGVIYRDGLGVSSDTAQAFTWFSLAGTQGYRPATDALRALLPSLSGKELLAARQLLTATQAKLPEGNVGPPNVTPDTGGSATARE